MPRTKQKARKKGAKGGGGKGKGEDEGPASASSSGARAQPEAAAATSTSSSKVPASASRARDDNSSSSETEHPAKKLKSDVAEPHEATSDHADDAGQPTGSNDSAPQLPPSPLEDLTTVAIEGDDPSKDTSNIRSSFGFSPAKPPAANVAWSSPTHRPSTLPPRHALASSASAQQWKISATQRHVDSFKFFSRDVLSREALPLMDIPCWDIDDDHEMRVDCYDVSGGLIWLQAYHVDNLGCEYTEHALRGSTILESAGRSRGNQRFFDTCEEVQWERGRKNRRSEHYLRESYIGFSPHVHPHLKRTSQKDIKLYAFNRKASGPRGLDPGDFGRQGLSLWPEYETPRHHTVLNAYCKPQLLADAACFEILHPVKEGPRPDELHVVLQFQLNDDDANGHDCFDDLLRLRLSAIHWAPSGQAIVGIPPPSHRQQHSAAAISEGTAYCWLGYADGRIELFDPSAYTFEVISARPDQKNTYAALDCPPEFCEVLPSSSTRGRVVALDTVGPTEVIATFSNGFIVLLQATSSSTAEVVREFLGFANDGSYNVKTSVHAKSRLLAVSGSDLKLRIWHLDDDYPLNSPWHRHRRGHEALDLVVQPHVPASATSDSAPSAAATSGAAATVTSIGNAGANAFSTSTPATAPAAPSTGMAALKSPSISDSAITVPSTSTTAASAQPVGPSLELLAMRSMTDDKARRAAQLPLRDLHWRNPCGMTFAPMSWEADRDAQWELTRDFDFTDAPGGRPKVVSTGLLPSIVTATSSLRGPVLIYFEPERKTGVEIEGEGEAAS